MQQLNIICDSRIHGLALSVETSYHLVYELQVLHNNNDPRLPIQPPAVCKAVACSEYSYARHRHLPFLSLTKINSHLVANL